MDLTMSCSSLSLLFLISLHIYFLVPASGYFQPFLDCDPFPCGDQQISYPFWHKEQESHCGYPGYELGCDRDNLILSMMSEEYRVIRMNLSTQILEVARTDLWEDICLQTYKDTTLDLNLFNYTSNDLNFTVLYYCDLWKTTPPYQFSCPESQNGHFFLSVDLAKLIPKPCSSLVHVPISRSAARDLPPPFAGGDDADAISEVLKKGFEITWNANTSLCENCTKSGGRCGYNITRQEFNCFCPDGAYFTTCDELPIPESVSSGKPGILGTKAIIGIAAMGTGIGIALILMISFRKKPMIRRIMALIKQRSENFDGEMKIRGLVSSRRYTYKDIKRMTNSFEEKLGQGGYGCVYKDKL
ncbi:LEAF RUST 10 DISEASE-RESISTANCE LOCUS RECEPTOR-LIKE PROTEIN KINASE-like 2.7 [Syzygium oleosum]|uniref:LEAF RUST 10 DISEASE-RESISTANCE LOCUS RECEPTOR-LIKE PROTEIN KINASE-like 2.7 n=1 Tax=Syzygium oleosum TaxID=219896 RepID=UPI0024B9D929|nr:LEAF RUST 10 DISEASE-RESISTANCE LOCUS RECEPTOR-LIKE PROTEIN KINASE-like 2.7 [Syzygium oleosum]